MCWIFSATIYCVNNYIVYGYYVFKCGKTLLDKDLSMGYWTGETNNIFRDQTQGQHNKAFVRTSFMSVLSNSFSILSSTRKRRPSLAWCGPGFSVVNQPSKTASSVYKKIAAAAAPRPAKIGAAVIIGAAAVDCSAGPEVPVGFAPVPVGADAVLARVDDAPPVGVAAAEARFSVPAVRTSWNVLKLSKPSSVRIKVWVVSAAEASNDSVQKSGAESGMLS